MESELDKKDIIAILGKPDKVLPTRGGMMTSKRWKCSKCQTVHDFHDPVRPPSPCCVCGGIAFEKLTPAPVVAN